MLLALDVGNTNTVAGLFRGAELLYHWRLPTQREATADGLAVQLLGLLSYHGLSGEDVAGMAVACVVPPLLTAVEQMSRRYFGCTPLIVGPGIETGIDVRYENPREVGADRVVNAVAAYAAYGGPAIVVDFGTATTFDAISAGGEYLGGAIAPGIGISLAALFREAAMLPRIELARPNGAIGRNTVASIQAGAVFGFAGQVDALVRRIRAELGGHAFAVATGGLAPLIAAECETVDAVDPLLTLTGLRLIYERNEVA